MFRHSLRPILRPIIRNAVVLGLTATLLYSLGLSQAIAAPQTVTRDPQALTAIASSLKALTGRTTVNDVILQTTVSRVAGSDDETGTGTLTASGNQESLVQLYLSGGTRQEIRDGPAGAWIGPDGTVHSMMTNNCWTDGSWFFPVLTLGGGKGCQVPFSRTLGHLIEVGERVAQTRRCCESAAFGVE